MQTDKSEIQGPVLNFLTQSQNIVATLSSCSKTGEPRSSVVYFWVDEELDFYFLTAADTKKYKNLLENPMASFAVGFGPEYVTVQAEGRATLLEKGSDEENNAIANIKNRLLDNNVTWPIFQLSDYDNSAIAVFKITPASMTFLNLSASSALPMTESGFKQVILGS